MQAKFQEITFTDADVCNPDDWIPDGEYNPHNVRPWLLHDHGFVICIVFADCLQDALDEAVDQDKMDRFMVDLKDAGDRDDYLVKDVVTPGYDPECPVWISDEGESYWWQDGREPESLGNAGEPFDIESLGFIELPNPPRSFVAQWAAKFQKESVS